MFYYLIIKDAKIIANPSQLLVTPKQFNKILSLNVN